MQTLPMELIFQAPSRGLSSPKKQIALSGGSYKMHL